MGVGTLESSIGCWMVRLFKGSRDPVLRHWVDEAWMASWEVEAYGKTY
jgi:hypothetical protein